MLTQEYKAWYDELNKQLDRLVTCGAAILTEAGYKTIAQTREYVGNAEVILQSTLPHKTVATRAGMGWIGKCALLVTENYGSMVRLSSILTDAPLTTAEAINQSKCGNCMLCANACPGGAVTGKVWAVTSCRSEIFDAVKCRDTARERSKHGRPKADNIVR